MLYVINFQSTSAQQRVVGSHGGETAGVCQHHARAGRGSQGYDQAVL